MTKPDLSLESSCKGIVVGVDEAGRGPWAGPVVAAAVILNRSAIPDGINDSKKLKPEQRDMLYAAICASSQWGVGVATVSEIDTFNILAASLLAMRRAVEALNHKADVALVDGNRRPKLPSCRRVQLVVEGDAKCLSIAAASIIAKVTRDRMMRELAQSWPGYGWQHNVGYGTHEHQAALIHYGVTPHHRRSFAPVSALIEATELVPDLFGRVA